MVRAKQNTARERRDREDPRKEESQVLAMEVLVKGDQARPALAEDQEDSVRPGSR
jgi:hypothetical protein